jgi:hypothetical protein
MIISGNVNNLDILVIWYIIMWYFIKGFIYLIKVKYIESLIVLLPLILLTVTFAFTEGNFGTAFRHRAQIIPILIIISSVGLFIHREKILGINLR